MAKQDLSQLKETLIPNTRSKEKIEHEKALKVLEEAKKIPRKVVFVKRGESEFTRNLNKKEIVNDPELLSAKEAAKYIGLGVNAFNVRKNRYKIPYEKLGQKHLYKKSILDAHIQKHPFREK